MPSEKQIQAARANGARSKGPATEQGKLNSSRNSVRHGLLARTVVLEEESAERFLELLAALTEEYQPASTTQVMLVETMAVARWRQLRVWGVQKAAMDRDIALQDPAVGPASVRAIFAFRGASARSSQPPGQPHGNDDTCPAELLLRYEIAFDRQFTRALNHLIALQSRPSARPPAPYHPEFPAGQTWKERTERGALAKQCKQSRPAALCAMSTEEETPTAKRTQEVVESTSPPARQPARPSGIRAACPPFKTAPASKPLSKPSSPNTCKAAAERAPFSIPLPPSLVS